MSSLNHYERREQRRSVRDASAYFDLAARSAAASLFLEAQARGRWRRLWRMLRGLPRRLRQLDEIDPASVVGKHEAVKVQAVPINRIVGSAGRAYDFDRAFYPLRTHTRDRWISVADLWYRGVELPPVSLVKAGDAYFVVDGHHRISVARVFGAATIAAVVTVWRLAEAPAAQPVGQLSSPLPCRPAPLEKL